MIMLFILVNLVLAKPIVRTISNPNAPRILRDGTEQDKFIFKFNKEIDDSLFSKHWFKSCMSSAQVLEKVKMVVGDVAGCNPKEVLKEMENDDDVAQVEEDSTVYALERTDDTYYDDLWGMIKINAPQAWDTFQGTQKVIVAVIDTGIDHNHEDLKCNMWTNSGEIPNNGIDDDGNGYIDDVHGINAITDSGNSMDDNKHGSHCGGTVGAVGNNKLGVAGVAWNVSLMALKFLKSNGSGSSINAIKCLNYALAFGVKISNNSWGGGPYNQALHNILDTNPEHMFIAAAGNNNSDNDEKAKFPCSDTKTSLCIASTDPDDKLSSFSNWGSTRVDIAAPGRDIMSTIPSGTDNRNRQAIYKKLSGTSMATPHVAGLAAVLWGACSKATAAEIKNAILTTGDSIASKNVNKPTKTNARINAAQALENLMTLEHCKLPSEETPNCGASPTPNPNPEPTQAPSPTPTPPAPAPITSTPAPTPTRRTPNPPRSTSTSAPTTSSAPDDMCHANINDSVQLKDGHRWTRRWRSYGCVKITRRGRREPNGKRCRRSYQLKFNIGGKITYRWFKRGLLESCTPGQEEDESEECHPKDWKCRMKNWLAKRKSSKTVLV